MGQGVNAETITCFRLFLELECNVGNEMVTQGAT